MAQSGRKYVCPRMKTGRTCNGSDCSRGSSSGNGNSDGNSPSGEFHHPPVCEDPEHNNGRIHERPDSCQLWHLWKASPNGNGGSKSKNGVGLYKNKNGSNVNSGNNPHRSSLEKENERLKKN
jgi:hypothetical protein